MKLPFLQDELKRLEELKEHYSKHPKSDSAKLWYDSQLNLVNELRNEPIQTA